MRISDWRSDLCSSDLVLTATTGATTTDLEIQLDSSLFTIYTSGGSASKPIDFVAETIPFNPYRSQGRRCYVGSIELLIKTNVGDRKSVVLGKSVSGREDLGGRRFIKQKSNKIN